VTEQQAKEICGRALSFVTADEATAALTTDVEAATRFANSEIIQSTAKSNAKLSVRAAFGDRLGSASVNAFDDETLKGAVARAEEMAKVAAPDTEFVPCPGPSEAPEADAYDTAVEQVGPQERAEMTQVGIETANREKVALAGSMTTESAVAALANTKGAFFYFPSTFARFVCTAMTDSSSGWAEGVSHRLDTIDPAALALRASQKANAAKDPAEVEPGDWTVVLEPAAVADMLVFVAFSLDAKAAIEGRSVFHDKEGTQVAAPGVNVYADPGHAGCPDVPFHQDGMPAARVDWIRDGKLETLSYDRFWAKKADRPYTGRPSNLIMSGGDHSEEELIAKVDRGLLVTRFWYIRHVDPMQLLLTGMTRDGVFLIENGKVTRGVKNLRFNESPLVMLRNVEALGKPKRCGAWVATEAPGMVVRDYTFTSGTSF
jgi:predicted Zn-dependent protease